MYIDIIHQTQKMFYKLTYLVKCNKYKQQNNIMYVHICTIILYPFTIKFILIVISRAIYKKKKLINLLFTYYLIDFLQR